MKIPNPPTRNHLNRFAHRFGGRLSTAFALGLLAAISAGPSCLGAAYTWNVASGNWSTPANWTPTTTGPNGPVAGDSVIFGVNDTSASSTAVNNTVDAGFGGTISNLIYNSTSATAFHVTQVGSGQTLRVAGPVLVGGVNGAAANVTTEAYLTGGGALVISKGSLTVQNYNNTSAQGSTAFLNLSGLSSFIFTNSTGTVSIEDNPGANTRLGGNLILAGVSNSITATNINLGTSTSAQAGAAGSLVLGPGTNIINVANFNLVNNKCTFTVSNSGGGLRIRGLSGAESARATVTIGNRNVANSTGATTGNMWLNGCAVNILAGTLTVGEAPNTAGPSGAAGFSGNGNLQFDTGIIDATSLVMAFNSSPNAGGGVAVANANVTVGANAVLRVGTGGISLMNQTASNVCFSTLAISNGTVVCNGNITAVTNAADGTGAAGATNLIKFIGGGTLTLGAGCVTGTTNSPIGQIILDTNTTLKFTAPPNNQPEVAVDTLTWPSPDTGLTFVVSNLPSTATIGTTVPLVQFASMVGGTFTAPAVSLPAGVTGSLSLNGNTVLLTINSSVYPYFTPVGLNVGTLCTNQTVSCTAASTVSTITNVVVVAQTTTLGGITTSTTTNVIGTAGLAVAGLNSASAGITYSLAANAIYTSITFIATDANGVTISQTVPKFDTLTPALVIEAADFNFSNGLFIDTPRNGGVALYTNQVGSQGIDENKGSRTATKSYYRPSDAVIIQNATPALGTPPSLTEQKFLDAAASGDTLDVEQEVGFNSAGDWVNYTRTFGAGGSAPAGSYNVWCYLATSGSGTQISFSQVTNDPTQMNQFTNFLGTFGNASFSDNGFNNYVYVPLVDQFGNRVTVTVGSGPQTFKATVIGNPNIAYYMLMPVAPVLTPQVLHIYPDGNNSGFESTNKFSFTVGPAQGASINASGIQLLVNGSDVSSGLTLSQAGGVWTASLPIQSNLLYTAVVNVTNTAGLSTSYSLSFDTLSLNNFQWEAVDYDFSTNDGTAWHSGLFIDNPMPTGDTNAGTSGTPYPSSSPYLAPNSYNWYPEGFTATADSLGFVGAVALQGVDINYTNASGIQYAYRYDGTTLIGGTQAPPVVGSQIATDTLNGGLRYQFLAAQTNTSDSGICEFNLGWFNTGDWLNYTRTYPAGKFNVWGRLAGGAGPFSGTTLSLVTGGVGTSNQTTQVLGSFADSAAAGWQTYHWIPLQDTNGSRVVVSLNGLATLRLTSGNNLNPLFFMLTPALTVPPFSASLAPAGGNVQISIPTSFGFNYTLWQSSDLTSGTWTPVATAIPGDSLVHTVTQPASSGQTFYRVSAQ